MWWWLVHRTRWGSSERKRTLADAGPIRSHAGGSHTRVTHATHENNGPQGDWQPLRFYTGPRAEQWGAPRCRLQRRVSEMPPEGRPDWAWPNNIPSLAGSSVHSLACFYAPTSFYIPFQIWTTFTIWTILKTWTISEMNKFHKWTNFKFEQKSNLNIFKCEFFSKSERFSTLNNFQIWTLIY